jgi:type I site-specific restriction endonuclease
MTAIAKKLFRLRPRWFPITITAFVFHPPNRIIYRQFGSLKRCTKSERRSTSFLKAHENHIAIHKLKMNEPLTASDLSELEPILSESGIGKTPGNNG